jgi:hypothetical protein
MQKRFLLSHLMVAPPSHSLALHFEKHYGIMEAIVSLNETALGR